MLSVKNLTIRTHSKILVSQLNFDIKAGEIFALVGESGSGKTLTSLSILQLLPGGLKASGTIYYKNENLIHKKHITAVRGREIGFIFQNSDGALNPVFRVGEQLIEALKIHFKLSKQSAQKKAEKLLRAVELDSLTFDKYAHELSGGQKQRIMIALALAGGAKLLIADEPTTALDVHIQKQILSLLLHLRQTQNLSILLITHDLALVKMMANRIAVIKEGVLLEISETRQFFRAPKHPYTKILLNTLPVIKHNYRPGNLLLCIENLQVVFKKRIFLQKTRIFKALDDISFRLQSGCNLAIVGESGSGKSTIARAIMRELTPESGKIYYAHKDINTIDKINYAQSVQIVFQNVVSSFNPRKKIYNTLLEAMQALHIKDATEAGITKLFEEVGLEPELMFSLPHQLSGGQLQRAAIARALCVQPQIIICDEPTSALDALLKKHILDLLLKLQQEKNITYIFITHDMSIVRYFAHDMIVLKSGKIIESGAVEKVLSEPQSRYTKMLLESVLL